MPNTITRAQLIATIDPDDWALSVLGRRVQLQVALDDFVKAVLLDETIDATPALLAKLEMSFSGRSRTVTNLRRLFA